MSGERGRTRRLSLAALLTLVVVGVVGSFSWYFSWRNDSPAEDEGPREFRTTRPRADDEDLEATVQRLLGRVVNDPDVLDEELMEELLEALNREEVGSAMRREEAAWDAVDQMMDAADQFEGEHSGSDAMRQRALRQQASTLVRELRAATSEEEQGPLTFAPRPEGYRRLVWDELTDIDYEEGDALPEQVLSLNGERVAMAGFLVEASYNELLLVQSVWSCCFGQPPAVHEAVVVLMENEPDDDWFDGIVRVVGTLEVGEEREDGYLLSVYRLRARQVDVPE